MNEARAAKVGEKKLLILQTIAEMLERPAAEKVTTALLAKQLQVSEAALYRHFASKAQMYEGIIEFIETGVFSVINQIEAAEESGLKQAEAIVASLLRFAQKNRGLTRVLVEGGARLASSLLKSGLADQLLWYRAPCVMGDGASAVSGLGISRLAEMPRVMRKETIRLGEDVLETYLFGT